MFENFMDIFQEVMIVSRAKRKIEEGIELTEEEKDKVLQQIYSSAKKELKDGQELRSTKAKLGMKTLSIVSRLMGEKGKGLSDATKTVLSSTKNNVDNYKRLLKGVNITSENQIMENFATLIAQYEASESYGKMMIDFVSALMEVNESYKKDYASPIKPELPEQMEEKREEVIALDAKYIRR